MEREMETRRRTCAGTRRPYMYDSTLIIREPVWRGRKACRPHTLHAVKLAREHKNSRRWSRLHHVFQKMKMGNGRVRPRSGRISGAPKASEPIVGLGCRVRVSVRASHGQNTSCVGIFAYLLKKSSFGVADFSSAPNNPPVSRRPTRAAPTMRRMVPPTGRRPVGLTRVRKVGCLDDG